jgi:hypothetical protein
MRRRDNVHFMYTYTWLLMSFITLYIVLVFCIYQRFSTKLYKTRLRVIIHHNPDEIKYQYNKQKHYCDVTYRWHLSKWVGDFCLRLSGQLSAISWREQFECLWDDDDVRFELDQHA